MESAAGDLGQVADLGTFADPHHRLVIEWGVWPSWSVSSGLQAMAPIAAACGYSGATAFLATTLSPSANNAATRGGWPPRSPGGAVPNTAALAEVETRLLMGSQDCRYKAVADSPHQPAGGNRYAPRRGPADARPGTRLRPADGPPAPTPPAASGSPASGDEHQAVEVFQQPCHWPARHAGAAVVARRTRRPPPQDQHAEEGDAAGAVRRLGGSTSPSRRRARPAPNPGS